MEYHSALKFHNDIENIYIEFYSCESRNYLIFISVKYLANNKKFKKNEDLRFNINNNNMK